MLAALVVLLAVSTIGADARHRWSQQTLTPSSRLTSLPEPSSRDLDVGIAIGVPEDDNSVTIGQPEDAINLAGVSDPSGRGMIYTVPGWIQNALHPISDPPYLRYGVQNQGPVYPAVDDRRQQQFVVNQQGVPVRAIVQNLEPAPLYTVTDNNRQQPFVVNQQSVPAEALLQNPSLQSVPMYPVADDRTQHFLVNQQGVPIRTVVQNAELEPVPLYSVADDRTQQQLVVNQQGVPVMTARPYGERRIGTFRLRNDRGYQVMMEVPPSPTEVDKDGVLVMEMKATLYRPLQ